jgi:hypothetical protein
MKPRDRLVLLAVVVLAIAAGGWFGLIAPKRSESAKLDAQIAEQRSVLQAAEGTLATAEAAKRRFRADYSALARLGKAVPVTDDVPSLVFQLETAAEDLGIEFDGIQVTAQAPGAPGAAGNQAAVAAAASGAEAKDAQTSKPAGGAQPASVPGAAPAGFTTVPFSFTFDGSYFAVQKLLARMTRFTQVRDRDLVVRGRLLAVDGLELGAGGKGFPRVRATIKATAYVLPPDASTATPAGAAAVAAAAAPAGTPAAAPAAPGQAAGAPLPVGGGAG